MNKHEVNEITSLNFADLDVEELERRLELAATMPDVQPLGVWCDCNGNNPCQQCTCYDAGYCSDCPSYCGGYCIDCKVDYCGLDGPLPR